jgi:hypothetical protein
MEKINKISPFPLVEKPFILFGFSTAHVSNRVLKADGFHFFLWKTAFSKPFSRCRFHFHNPFDSRIFSQIGIGKTGSSKASR